MLGQNGSGKSVLVGLIARSWASGSVVVFDPKGDDREAMIPNASIAYTHRDVIARLPGRVIYRPGLGEYEKLPGSTLPGIWARWDLICRRLYDQATQGLGRPALAVIHELATLCSSYAIGPAFAQLIREGRSKAITLGMLTQRPQGTHPIARSEAQHVIAFTLADQAARDVAAELLTDIEDPSLERLVRIRPLPLDRRWWYRGPDFRLRLHAPVPYPADGRS